MLWAFYAIFTVAMVGACMFMWMAFPGMDEIHTPFTIGFAVLNLIMLAMVAIGSS